MLQGRDFIAGQQSIGNRCASGPERRCDQPAGLLQLRTYSEAEGTPKKLRRQ